MNKCLNKHTTNLTISENVRNIDFDYEKTNEILIKEFIKSKKLKGLSNNSLIYYETQLYKFASWTIKSFIELTSNDLKEYLAFYKSINGCGETTLNNTRHILSSFYG